MISSAHRVGFARSPDQRVSAAARGIAQGTASVHPRKLSRLACEGRNYSDRYAKRCSVFVRLTPRLMGGANVPANKFAVDDSAQVTAKGSAGIDAYIDKVSPLCHTYIHVAGRLYPNSRKAFRHGVPESAFVIATIGRSRMTAL